MEKEIAGAKATTAQDKADANAQTDERKASTNKTYTGLTTEESRPKKNRNQ
jgi:hypothetical protein